MPSLLPFVLAAMNAIAPSRDHSELGGAIAHVVTEEAPLFADDAGRERTAALVVAVAFRESSLRNDAVGDNGHSVCAMQIYDGPKALLADPEACIRRGLSMLRQSIRIDRDFPIAFYARGPGWKSEAARKISRDRVALARRLHAAATAALAAESSSALALEFGPEPNPHESSAALRKRIVEQLTSPRHRSER